MKKSCMYFLKFFSVVLQCAAVLMWFPVSASPSPENIDRRPGIVCPGNEGGEEGEPGIAPQDDGEPLYEIPN